jgi:polysaccharide export outer membrane protein
MSSVGARHVARAPAGIVGLAALLVLTTLSFPMVSCAQSGANYLLGSGDVVKITVYNNPDLTTEAQITGSGKIVFPLIGEVEVAGLDKGQAEAKLAKRLLDGKFVVNPQVNLLISQYRSQQVSVLGQVNKPGKIPLDMASNLTDLLASAGGIAPTGADFVVVISKDKDGREHKREIDLNMMMLSGKTATNVPIASGDIIYVPRAPMFFIYGEVQHPGSYRLERDMTVMQALSVGGGLTPRGTERGIQVNRREPDGAVRTLEPKLTDKLRENDVVNVKESLF